MTLMTRPDEIRESLLARIYDINVEGFEQVAMEVWKFQFANNDLYQSFCHLLHKDPSNVTAISDIPFLPVSVFKEHLVKTGTWDPQCRFESSGTTGSQRSQHLVRDRSWYHAVAQKGFSTFLGSPGDFIWVGLLPSYLDRPDSSLVDMVDHFMTVGGHEKSGFFPAINDQLVELLNALFRENEAVVLIGVSFALLDLFDHAGIPVWDRLLVIETGGMKGRGKELTREELYDRMRARYPALRIASEYGMTELLSQAYRIGGRFLPGPTMGVFIRDVSDPLRLIGQGQRGAINIIDLANIDTCAFIATEDVGVSYVDGSFEALGRLDLSDMRGCNLMYTSAS